MLKNLIQRLLKRFRDSDVIWEDTRGEIRHQYTFSERDDDVRASCTKWPNLDRNPIIKYHLTQYNAEDELCHFYLVEDTVHELTHWAVDRDYGDDRDHCLRWKTVLYPEICYVNGWEISIDD